MSLVLKEENYKLKREVKHVRSKAKRLARGFKREIQDVIKSLEKNNDIQNEIQVEINNFEQLVEKENSELQIQKENCLADYELLVEKMLQERKKREDDIAKYESIIERQKFENEELKRMLEDKEKSGSVQKAVSETWRELHEVRLEAEKYRANLMEKEKEIEELQKEMETNNALDESQKSKLKERDNKLKILATEAATKIYDHEESKTEVAENSIVLEKMHEYNHDSKSEHLEGVENVESALREKMIEAEEERRKVEEAEMNMEKNLTKLKILQNVSAKESGNAFQLLAEIFEAEDENRLEIKRIAEEALKI